MLIQIGEPEYEVADAEAHKVTQVTGPWRGC